jgi:hypothetical protein
MFQSTSGMAARNGTEEAMPLPCLIIPPKMELSNQGTAELNWAGLNMMLSSVQKRVHREFDTAYHPTPIRLGQSRIACG